MPRWLWQIKNSGHRLVRKSYVGETQRNRAILCHENIGQAEGQWELTSTIVGQIISRFSHFFGPFPHYFLIQILRILWPNQFYSIHSIHANTADVSISLHVLAFVWHISSEIWSTVSPHTLNASQWATDRPFAHCSRVAELQAEIITW